MNKPTCKTCRWWAQTGRAGDKVFKHTNDPGAGLAPERLERTVGDCRRYSPIARVIPGFGDHHTPAEFRRAPYAITEFPQTSPEDWCGEYATWRVSKEIGR